MPSAALSTAMNMGVAIRFLRFRFAMLVEKLESAKLLQTPWLASDLVYACADGFVAGCAAHLCEV